MISTKSRTTLIILSLFLGVFWIDRFYAGRVLLGILKLSTVSFLGIWILIDLILAITGTMKDEQWLMIKRW
ncbi:MULTISPECIES: TM2 domain-containing protein [unclassified Mycoplasma]|uniref:TM2 domain-containing protein n=1 Tax=unclassified Mycoplasma TaxID=2683645 RepID=UPI00211B822D|nr:MULTISPECIES: TM2 domain-containing protein [unclassified Mycoplasma]UUM19829.1 TM2 domain-containing protein [Mycoplasma sp. 1578d]UUM24813.1 TM2 domain-containing protein [Mycoplasma sp. 3686d]